MYGSSDINMNNFFLLHCGYGVKMKFVKQNKKGSEFGFLIISDLEHKGPVEI